MGKKKKISEPQGEELNSMPGEASAAEQVAEVAKAPAKPPVSVNEIPGKYRKFPKGEN